MRRRFPHLKLSIQLSYKRTMDLWRRGIDDASIGPDRCLRYSSDFPDMRKRNH